MLKQNTFVRKKTLLILKYIPGVLDHISKGQTLSFSEVLPISECSPLFFVKWLNVFTFRYTFYQR